ncbi:MAG: hypothetical protein HY999_05180, partial [Nitrospinae bacterium]|nr:hypothetical protein [Nitrospinota bacterium]
LSSERLISFIKEDEKRMGFVSENTLEIGLKNRGWEAMCLEIKGCLQCLCDSETGL